MSDIPLEFFRDLCCDIDHPLAAVSPESRFVWVNNAFERLVGYAITELIDQTWQSITKQSDVGADLAGVQAVLEGRVSSYRMEKSYIHKRKHEVPVELTVRRFPVNHMAPLILFRVEAPPARATRPELDAVHDELLSVINDLKKRIIIAERRAAEKVSVSVGDKWKNGDKTGRDKLTNSDQAVKLMVGAIVALGMCVAWMMYYVATISNNTPPAPPQQTVPE